MAVASREFLTRNSFDLELHQHVALAGTEPTPALATVKKFAKQKSGIGAVEHGQHREFGRKSVHSFEGCDARFVNSPTKRESPNPPCNGKGKVRLARTQFAR